MRLRRQTKQDRPYDNFSHGKSAYRNQNKITKRGKRNKFKKKMWGATHMMIAMTVKEW